MAPRRMRAAMGVRLRPTPPDKQFERAGVRQAGFGGFRGLQAELAEREQQPVRFVGRIVAVLYGEKESAAANVSLRCAVDPLCRPSCFNENVEQLSGEAHGFFRWHRGDPDFGCRKLAQSREKLGALNFLQPATGREVPGAIPE